MIASGYSLNVITNIVSGARIGTLFVEHPERELATARHMAVCARKSAHALLAVGSQRRQELLLAVANNLLACKDQIIEANQKDISNARKNNLRPALASRLVLDEKKLNTLAEGKAASFARHQSLSLTRVPISGVKQIAIGEDPIGRVLKRRELAENLILQEVRVPIGVLLVIFEARPDVLPQVAALAIRSGNGLILKGGKEAINTNTVLHTIITGTIAQFGIDPQLVGLVQTHEQIEELLQLKEIDLVVPRGSADLVSHIQNNTSIPVLGHSEGVCHVYVDSEADIDMAARIVVDAKTDYPAACNAAEVVLIHRDLVVDGRAQPILAALKQNRVQLYAGPRAVSFFQDMVPASVCSLSLFPCPLANDLTY